MPDSLSSSPFAREVVGECEEALLKAVVKARLLDAPELAPRMGRFRLARYLGQGAGGIVYEAVDPESGEIVALKLLREREPLALARFKLEFRALAGLAHENLVQLYELFSERGQWCFAMELVAGTDFAGYVRVAGACDHARLRAALGQLIAGVSAIHSAGKLHCDLKPSNLRVTPEGRVVVLDFGFVTMPRHERVAESSGGTPAYMAPELIEDCTPTRASDAYSIGVILFQALTGALPFEGTPARILADKSALPAPRASALQRGVPEALDALCAALLERDPARRCTLARAQEQLGGINTSEPRVVETHAAPFLGRDPELAALREALQDVLAGRPIAVLVGGPSGVGKSVLVERFVSELPEHALVLRGRCYDRESTPYKAFDEVIDRLAFQLKALPQSEVRALAPDHPAALLRVFPAFSQVPEFAQRSSAPLPANNQELRARAFFALKQLLARLACARPLVLIVDDLQWAELDSARLLKALLGPPSPPRLLYVGCHRNEQLVESGFLRELLGEHAAMRGYEQRTLALGPFDQATAVELARRLLDDKLDDSERVAQRIGARALGLPFAVRELARHALSGGGEVDRLSLGDLLVQRLAALSLNERRTLALLALAKGPIAAHVLRQVGELGADWYRDVRALQVAGFVRGDASGAFSIDHDWLRERIAERLSAEERVELHRALALACERVPSVDPEWLVEHWRGAGDAARALGYALTTAQDSAQQLAFSRAADLYRIALDLVARDDPRRPSVQQELGDALANAGRGGEAAETLLQTSCEVEAESAFALRCRAVQQYLRSGDTVKAEALARELAASVGLAWPKSLTAIFVHLFRVRALIEWRSRARSGRQRKGDGRRLQLLEAMFREYAVADPSRGLLLQAHMYAEALQSGDAETLFAGALWDAYNVAFMRGARGRAGNAKRLARVQRLAEELNTPYARATVEFLRAAICMWEGRLREIEKPSAVAIEIFQNECVGTTWEESFCAMMRYSSIETTGPISKIADEVPGLVSRAMQRGDGFSVAMLLNSMSLVLLAQDQPEQALALVTEQRERLGTSAEWAGMLMHERQISCGLYLGGGVEVFERFELYYHERYLPSIYERNEIARVVAHFQRARCAIAAYGARPEPRFVQVIEHEARVLLRIKRPEGQIAGSAIAAALAFVRGDRARAIELAQRAVDRAHSAGQWLSELACRYRLGEIMGGQEGARIHDDAKHALEAQGIVDPRRWCNAFAPIGMR